MYLINHIFTNKKLKKVKKIKFIHFKKLFFLNLFKNKSKKVEEK